MPSYTLTNHDVSLVLAMKNRGDDSDDIAAWFAVNQGRVASTELAEKYPQVTAAAQSDLAKIPKGPPGKKGKILRAYVEKAVAALDSGDPATALKELQAGLDRYSKHEN